MKKRTKKTVGVAAKVFVRLLLATVLCVILYISMAVISMAMFKEEVGYMITDANGPQVYYYQDGDVIQTAESLGVEPDTFTPVWKPAAAPERVMQTISQVLMLILFCVFPYNILWEFGNRDDTNVRYRGQRPEPWRGLKIGLLAMAPYYVSWLVLVVSKFVTALQGFIGIYRLILFPYWYHNIWILGDNVPIADVVLWKLFLLLPAQLLVPITCAIAYRMGGKQFSLTEFLTFTKSKDNPADTSNNEV